MKEEPNYYAIIPANIRYDEDLIQGSKLLYGEITALSNQKGFCWANDMYFANLYKVSKKTIQTWLKSLEVRGYLTREVIYKEGSNEIVSRYIRLCAYPSNENVHTPMHEKVRDNNTSINTTINNTSNKNILSSSDEQDDTPNLKETNLDKLKTDFELIWTEYPKNRRKDKQKCFTRYKNALKDGDSHEDILAGLMRYKKEISNKQTANEFIRLSSTWFNNKNWNDDYDIGQGGNYSNFENIDSEWVR